MQDPGSFINTLTDLPIPAAMMTRVINRQVGNLKISAKFRVVDTSLRIQEVLGPKPRTWNENTQGPWDTSDISPLITPDGAVTGTVAAVMNHDSTRGVHRDLSFSMIDPIYVKNFVTIDPLTGLQGFPFNPLVNFIQAFQVFLIPGVIRFEVSIGYYVMFQPTEVIQSGFRYFNWQALDLSAFVAQTPFISDWVVYRGYPGGYLGAVKDLLTSDGIPISLGGLGVTPTGNDDAGPGIPAEMIPIGDPTLFPDTGNQEVPRDILFQAGTNRMDAINQLLEAINFYHLFTDSLSRFRSRQIPDFGTPDAPNIPAAGWDYSTDPEFSIIDGQVTRDFLSQANANIANIVKVEGTPTTPIVNWLSSVQPAGTGQTFTSLLQNTGLNLSGQVISQLGTKVLQGLGGKPRGIPRYDRNDSLANQQMADLYGNLLLQEGSGLTETVSYASLVNPLHEDHEFLIVKVFDKNGHVYVPSSAQSPLEEQSFSLPLQGVSTRMTHQVVRVDPV